MSSKWASKLTDKQFAFCRRVEAAGLASVSQAVKAFERGDTARIDEWKRELAKRNAS